LTMFSLVYISSAVRIFSDKQLLELLEQSRTKNLRLEITGMLLYKEGSFMQALEGSRENVLSVMKSIRVDPRHESLVILLEQEHPQRHFPDWSMGFKSYNAEEEDPISGYTDFLNLPLTSTQFQENPSRAMQLLLSFKKSTRGH
jgi:hypothetical protein